MDVKPPKRSKNIVFGKNPRLTSDIRRVKEVSSTLKPKAPNIISSAEINQKIKEKVVEQVGQEKNPKRLKLKFFVAGLLFIFVAAIFFVNIQNFPKVTAFDQILLTQSRSVDAVAEDILFAPKKIAEIGLTKAGISIGLSAKLISASVAFISVCLFFVLARQWVSFKIAVLSTFLFSSSTWVIFQARDTGYGSTLLILIPLIFLSGIAINKKKSGLVAYALALMVSLSLYTPGFIWLLLAGIIFYFKNIKKYLTSLTKTDKAITISVFLAPLFPLFYFLVKDMSLFKNWLGLHDATTLSTVVSNISKLPNQIMLSGVDSPLIWLKNTPIIDMVSIILVITGLIYIFSREKYTDLKKSILLFVFIIIVLIALNGYEYISLLVPLIYILLAVGLTFLLEQWFHIFPRNPLARSIGFTIITILVGIISSYHLVRYFVAWPRVDATKQAYISSQSVTISNETKELK